MMSSSGPVILDETPCEKDLGIMIDSELDFDEHISLAVKKANAKLAMIRRTFVYMDKQIDSTSLPSKTKLQFGASP